MDETITALNAFRPRILVGYASALRPLAGEQRQGRLRIAPESVFSASEALSVQAAREMSEAWGAAPFDVYAATETAGISSPCAPRVSLRSTFTSRRSQSYPELRSARRRWSGDRA